MKTLTIHNPARPELNDFCNGIPGELALITPTQWVCLNPDCGCDHSFIGMNSRSISTTAIVTDLAMTFADLTSACVGYLQTNGFSTTVSTKELKRVARLMVGETAELASFYDTGTVLRTRYERDEHQWRFIACEHSHDDSTN